MRLTQFDLAWLDEGRKTYRHYLDKYAKCLKENNWPSYDQGVPVVNPPRWAAKFTTIEGI